MNDLRDYIEKVKELGEYKLLEGADWNLEIGEINQWQVTNPASPLLVFDKIKGYPPGFRVVCNAFTSQRREALALRLPLESRGLELVRAWKDKVKAGIKPVPPVVVKTGPVMENVQMGDKVDLFTFPVPKFREGDGGRYIGTAHAVIMKDPDEGWINLGTYRVQVHDKNTVTVYMSPGRHGHMIRQKYWAQGKPCPCAVVIGGDPAIFAYGLFPLAWKQSEYDYAGWLRGKPLEVFEGPVTGLPLPADAEIVFEGEMMPPDVETRVEGPFAEFTGYYASQPRPEPAVKVKSVFYRNNPILICSPPTMPDKPHSLGMHTRKSAEAWNDLDKALPGIKGVYTIDEPLAGKMIVVSLKQMYAGHARQAAMMAASNPALAYLTKWFIVVDDDVDPSNIREVTWAMATRCEPFEDIDFVRNCWGSGLDARLPPEKVKARQFDHSIALVLAVKPFSWIKDFPKDIKLPPETLKKIKDKWGGQF